MSVPGSKKIILELPLVIGSRSGIGSRSSSMASQTSSEMSWVDLNLPDAPEGEWSGIHRVVGLQCGELPLSSLGAALR